MTCAGGPRSLAPMRTESELYAAIAYQDRVGLLPISALWTRPSPQIVAVPVTGVAPSTAAAVVVPVLNARPAAVAFAGLAANVAARSLDIVPGRRRRTERPLAVMRRKHHVRAYSHQQ